MAKTKPPTKDNKKSEEKSLMGRPPTWTSPEVLEHMVDEYFKREQKPTLAGLAVSLGISRSTLYEYDKKDDFSYIIKRAREQVEEIYEQLLLYNGQPTGVIFALKNMGWADSSKVDHTTKGKEMKIGVISYEDTENESK